MFTIEMSASVAPLVLVVDDESDVADAYSDQLEDRYSVLTAYSGEEALELMDDTVDVVLLDRRMPGLSGDEVLERIRERGYNCRVAMVTAVDPDFEIIEMEFDDYVTKPVSRDELFDTIERLLTFQTYEEQFQEYYRMTMKTATLQANKSNAELMNTDAYQKLLEKRDELRQKIDETLGSVADEDISGVLKTLDESTEM